MQKITDSAHSIEHDRPDLKNAHVVPSDDLDMWSLLSGRIGRNRRTLLELTNKRGRSKLSKILDDRGLIALSTVAKHEKPLGNVNVFNGEINKGNDNIFFFREKSGNRAPLYITGPAINGKRLYNVEVLHDGFPKEAPLRGMHPLRALADMNSLTLS